MRLPVKLQNSVVPRSDKPVMLRDVMPTVLDILGRPTPETVDGLSMYPLATGRNCEWREYAHGEHCTCYSEEQEMQYLTDGKIKYIWFPRLDAEQLFDLESDPYELHNLSEMAEYSGILKTWRLKLVRELEKRDCGMTDGDKLVSQKGKPGIASPHFRERISKYATAQEKAAMKDIIGFDLSNWPEK